MRSRHATRCPACRGELWRFDGEALCPDCTRFEPAAVWFKATAAGSGAYVEESQSLDRLLRVLRYEIMDIPGPEDVVISEGARVVAVIRGADGAVVRVRRGGGAA